MILFYIIEAAAIYTVIKQHPHDSDAAVCPSQPSSDVMLMSASFVVESENYYFVLIRK